MTDWIVKLYRKMNTTARRAAVLLLAFVIAMSTLHFMTFPATALTRKAGENDPGIVIGDETNTEGFDNASEGENTEVNPVNTETAPTEEPAVITGGETPAPADTTVNAEPTPDGNEEAAVIVEPTATPEVTPTPEPTETPAAEEESEEVSDSEADVETAEDWEDMFRDVELTGVWADDLLTLAELQKGYKESTKNFVRDDEGVKHGYTRYGAWYGDSYREWDSLFIMFNLYYAGITKLDFPYEADCEDWVESLKDAEMFREAGTYIPETGDLVFADTDEDGEADHVAIVKDVVFNGEGRPEDLVVIEGDADNEVKKSTYEFYNPLIIGFAQLPENPEMAKGEVEPESGIFAGVANRVEVIVEYESGTFPVGTTMQVKPVWNQSVIGAINDTVTDKEIVKVQAVDITFFDSYGAEIEPSKPVKVTMKSNDAPAKAEESPVVVHVDDELSTSVVSTEQVNSEAPQEAVAFETDAFSVYAIVYTVDFEYEKEGRMYRFSMTGGTSISLTDLCAVLGMNEDGETYEEFAARVSDVSFSDSSLIRIRHEDYGWMFYSLKPFKTEEVLTLSMDDGEEIVIRVTDDQNDGVWDLADTTNTQFLHVSAASSVTETEQERNAAFKLTFVYSLTEDVVRALDAYEGNPVLEYDLSSTIAQSPLEIKNNSNGVISIGTRRLGTYTVVDGKVRLTFTDPAYFDGKTTFTGYFTLTAETNETELGDEDEWEYHFPGTGDTVTIHYKDEIESASKKYNLKPNSDGSYTLDYTADINVHNALDTLTFIDELSGLQTLDAGSVKINGIPVSVSQSGQTFSFDVGSALGTTGVAKGNYKVTYSATVTEEQLKAMSADTTTEKNKASWKVNGKKDVPGGETSVVIEKPHEPVPVVKTISSTANMPGDEVNYTVTYGDETTELSKFHFSDSMTDVVIPQGQVQVNYNGQTTQIDFSNQSKDPYYSKGTTTLFDYTFPEGTPGYGPVTVTYSVKLIDAETAKNSGIYDSTEVINTAREHKYNTTDTKKTTVKYEKEPHYKVTKTESSVKTDGKWAPGTEIHYTLTIGDAETEMSGIHIRDVMTDLQTLQGDVMIEVGNGQQMRLTDYVAGAVKWNDDGNYSTNDTVLLDFIMPVNAGKGPVVITYTTKVIDSDAASAAQIYGDKEIRNTGYANNEHDSTSGHGVFDSFPMNKTVTQGNTDVNGRDVEMGSTVHYTLSFGKAGMDMKGTVIEDYMTDLQKLVGDITIRKADGTSFTMPVGTGQYSQDGNNWSFWDDGKYSESMICLFKYRLPDNIGAGPITVEYDAQMITEAEAKESGIVGRKSAYNRFVINGNNVQTEVKIPFPEEVKHNPQVRKEFDHWDIANSKAFWNIVIEKDNESAYPLENVKVREHTDMSGAIVFKSERQAIYYYASFKPSDFDIIHAVVTTDDGTVLTPGVDYVVDKTKAEFTFPVLNERVHINLGVDLPAKIIDGTYMQNQVILNDKDTAKAEETYHNPGIEVLKEGDYKENKKYIEWSVILNPSSAAFPDSDPKSVIFEDTIPSGLQLLNYSDETTNNPSISVHYEGSVVAGKTTYFSVNGEVEGVDGGLIHSITYDPETGLIRADIVPTTRKHKEWTQEEGNVYETVIDAGLDRQRYVVKYKTALSDEEWDRITSSLTGSEVFENHVEITTGGGEKFDAKDSVIVTSDEYINKFDTTPEDSSGLVIDEQGNPTKEISYKVEINPYGHMLNLGEPLQLTDFIATNMDLSTESVKIVAAQMGDDGRLVPVSEDPYPGLETSYNDDARQLAIRNIPDKTPLLLTYSCYARAQGEDTFTNTATLIGGGSHSTTVTDKHNIQTNDAGVRIDGIEMNLFKIDENNIWKKLEGAQFQLYECELVIGDLTNSDRYNQAWWEDLLAKVDRRTAGTSTPEEDAYIDAQFKITNYKPVGEPAVTGDKGFTQWSSLNEHKLYAWKEVGFPDGYTGNQDLHYFVGYQHIDVNTDVVPQPLLSEDEQLRRKKAAWALDDACQFANGIRVASMANLTTWTATNVEATYTSISATKVWENDWDDFYETRPTAGIILHLWRINADGSKEEVHDQGIVNPVPINKDENGNWPTYTWNKLLAKDADGNRLKYYVVEEPVENYSTTYSDEQLGKESGEIVVTNRLIPKSTDIHIKKVFEGIPEEEWPDSITATLYVIRTDRQGVVHEPEETDYSVELSSMNNWKWTFEKLPTKDNEGSVLSYTVVEDIKTLEGKGYRFVVTYSDDGKGVIETTTENPLTITNAKEAEIDITIKKVDDDNNPITGAKFELYKKNKSGSFVIVEKSEEYDWLDSNNQFTVDDISGFTMTSLKDGTYRVKEVAAPKGFIIINAEPIEFTVVDGKIDEAANVLTDGVEYTPAAGETKDAFIVPNEAGAALPKTGGTGTGILYSAGLILILVSGALLLRRQRRSI